MSSEIVVLDLSKEIELPHLEIHISSDWSSEKKCHRSRIRKQLKSYLQTVGLAVDNRVLELETIPSVNGISLSISHCKCLGGYAVAPGSVPIGFDIESVARVSRKIISRISSDKEISIAPSSPVFLWCAKEACFKALGLDLQIGKAYSSIVVSKWNCNGDKSKYFFHASCDKFNFLGVSFFSKENSCCLTIVKRI